MKIIGITGKSGSGKSFFASLLAQKLNCPYVDVDKIGHKASSDPEILKKFNNQTIQEIKDIFEKVK